VKENIDFQQYQEWVSIVEDPGANCEPACEETQQSVWDDSLISALVTCDEPEFPFTRRTDAGPVPAVTRSPEVAVRKQGRQAGRWTSQRQSR
jgi:hypothetical protein